MAKKKIVLAYSGGLDTSVMLEWLKEEYDCEVITFTGDLGQGEDLVAAKEKALRHGVKKAYIVDQRAEYARDFIVPALQAGAVYEGKYLLGTSLARPILAKGQVEIARRVGAHAVAHGATGKGNDQVRFELAFKALAPDLEIIAPWRKWEITGRVDALAYCKKRGIEVEVSAEKPYSIDRNMWHTSYEGGVLEDPAFAPEEEMFQLTVSSDKAPAKERRLTIGFKQGVPVSLDGKSMAPDKLIMALNKIAGANGVGRTDVVENRLVGIKSRGVYEAPAATVLYFAQRELEMLVMERELYHYKQQVSLRYAEMIYNGQWFHPLRESLAAFVLHSQQTVTGEVIVGLRRGVMRVISRRSPYSLYSKDLVTFEAGKGYDQKDAEGFINLFGLPTKLAGEVNRKRTRKKRNG